MNPPTFQSPPPRVWRDRCRFRSGVRWGIRGPQGVRVVTRAYSGETPAWSPEEAFVLTLARRPDRLERLRANLAVTEWPFRAPEVFFAVDGAASSIPAWWRCTAGAWGCLRSHELILETVRKRGATSVMIIEDDAWFPKQFGQQLTRFLRFVPPDWDGLMIGGQHMRAPQCVAEAVDRCRYTVRTHCYCLRAPALEVVLRAYRSGCDHTDRILGRLMSTFRFYAPSPMIVGQAAGRSDINYRDLPFRLYPHAGQSAELRRLCGRNRSHNLTQKLSAKPSTDHCINHSP